MWLLYLSLASLGLASIDPVGISLMPLFITQKRPLKRAFSFLVGSFVSLMIMGIILARGLGKIVLRFEHSHKWLLPSVEAIAGLILLVVAISVYIQIKRGKPMEPSKLTIKWLSLGKWHLFILGFILVAVQSILDVVFVVAMIRVGQFNYSNITLITAIGAYSLAALLIQVAVILGISLTPIKHRDKFIEKTRSLLLKFSSEALVVVALILSLILFGLVLSSSR